MPPVKNRPVKVMLESPDPKKHSVRYYGPGEMFPSTYLPHNLLSEMGADPKKPPTLIEVTFKVVK